MEIQRFKKVIGSNIKKVKEKQLYQASGSLRELAELLIKFYERKLAEEAVKKYDKDN